MFSWWIVGAIIRTKDYFAISGIARYATVHNGDYPLSLGLLTRGDAVYVSKRLVNYRIWGEEDGKSDGRRQAVILEDMVRILACINTDPPVYSLCIRSGWSIGRIRRRFILLALFWINLTPGRNGPTEEERKRILHSLTLLFSVRVTPAIFTASFFFLLKALLAVAHFGWKRVLKKLIPI